MTGWVSFQGAGSNMHTAIVTVECEKCEHEFDVDMEFDAGNGYWEGKCPKCEQTIEAERQKE